MSLTSRINGIGPPENRKGKIAPEEDDDARTGPICFVTNFALGCPRRVLTVAQVVTAHILPLTVILATRSGIVGHHLKEEENEIAA